MYVGPEHVNTVELTDEFGGLLREDLAEEVEAFASNRSAAFRAGGSTFDRVVELVGQLSNSLTQERIRSLRRGSD